ncbi:uncharacterized protein LOC126786890 [Argentina anserina]|uniref:uncharacterized protein LOC126786890 n=1 Tax=Argentina anserina TaxID=57926 RepID=UPI0021763818|nr:uncharacterized protein LOC126786890 [Potentilla anserina]
MECPELEMLYVHRTTYHGQSVQIPSDCFREMLRVLNLTNLYVPSLPLSLQYLKELQTLCLDDCELGDITSLGHLSSLEVLSLSRSDVRELPKEIGQLTLLRLLDLSDCSSLEVIPPTVISSLVKLEDLNMRDSFKDWEVEGEGSNASLSELKHLSQQSSLEIHIQDDDALPANLFSNKLERFNIYIGDVWDEWHDEWDAISSPWEDILNKTMTLNTLKLKLTKDLDESLKWLIKNSEYLSIDETEIVVVQELNAEDFENIIHLQLQNNVDFMAMVNKKVVFPNLQTLWVHGCDKLQFLFSFSMAKSLVQLTHLMVSECKLLQEIVSSTKEDGVENISDMFFKLRVLKLAELRDPARFTTGNYIEFPSLEELEVKKCDNMGAFIGGKVSMRTKGTRSCKEIEQKILEEDSFHNLEGIQLTGMEIWNGPLPVEQLVFGKLKVISVGRNCALLAKPFPPEITKS